MSGWTCECILLDILSDIIMITPLFFLSLICFEILFFIFLPKIVPTVDGEAHLLEKNKKIIPVC